MVPTLIVTEVMLILGVAFIGRRRQSATRLEDMKMVYSILAAGNIGVSLAWLAAMAYLGQYPTFNLYPVLVAGVACALLALRAGQLHHKQGKSPA